MFKTDGSVHYSGIANEGKTAEILNAINYFPDKVETRGGTKHKEDAVAGSLKLSAKDKKRLSSGSFDWGNISRNTNNIFGNYFDSFKDMIKNLRKENTYSRQYAVDGVREQFASLCNDAFDILTKDQVCDLIVDSITHGIDWVFVNDKENKVLYQFDPKNHPAIKLAKECDLIKFVTVRNAKGSRKVIFVKGGVEYDYGIRLRITNNNGINAFLGLSKSNNNSQIVLKLQQDAVHKLVKEHIECETISYA
jgi:hypothetical protein